MALSDDDRLRASREPPARPLPGLRTRDWRRSTRRRCGRRMIAPPAASISPTRRRRVSAWLPDARRQIWRNSADAGRTRAPPSSTLSSPAGEGGVDEALDVRSRPRPACAGPRDRSRDRRRDERGHQPKAACRKKMPAAPRRPCMLCSRPMRPCAGGAASASRRSPRSGRLHHDRRDDRPRPLPGHQPGSGACPDIQRSNRPYATPISSRSVFPESMRSPKPNSIEPPRYGTRMPGGVGGVASRGVPLSRSYRLCRRVDCSLHVGQVPISGPAAEITQQSPIRSTPTIRTPGPGAQSRFFRMPALIREAPDQTKQHGK